MTDIVKIENAVKPTTVVGKINEVIDSVNGKQDILVSGTNIKTVNNQSLLGSGNINASQNWSYDSTTRTLTIS